MNRKHPLHMNQPAAELPVPLEFDRSWLTQLESRLDKGGPWGLQTLSAWHSSRRNQSDSQF